MNSMILGAIADINNGISKFLNNNSILPGKYVSFLLTNSITGLLDI